MATVRIPDDVLVRSLGDEMVLLNLRTGHYYGLNRTGGRMVEILGEVGETQEAVMRIAAEYDAPVGQVAEDLTELCAALADQALIVYDTTTDSPPAGRRRSRRPPGPT